MNNLDLYVAMIKTKLKENNITKETEMIKYVYLDLGNRFSFDANFIPFGNSKAKQTLYKYHCRNIEDLNECMDKNIAICKSLSYILEYVLKELGVNIKTVIDPDDHRKCPHVFNEVIEKSGRKYCIDLQEDMNNIQSHSFTSNFGLESIYDDKLVVTRGEQEEIDRKIGYINDTNYYQNDYLYLLHSIVDNMDSFEDKIEFILENIDYSSTKNMGYTDRQWHHKKILEEFFNSKEFDYQNNTGKIRIIDCYKDVDDEGRYLNCIVVLLKDETRVYVYNIKDYKYCRMSIENFANAVVNGLVIHKTSVPGLGREINNIKHR